MKLIVAGSRTIKNYSFVESCINAVINQHKQNITEIVSGTARGVDRFGEQYAQKHNISLIKFPANWDKYGKSAGYKRNEEMADYADGLLAIWDGESRGTKHMIEIARKKSLLLWICKTKPMDQN